MGGKPPFSSRSGRVEQAQGHEPGEGHAASSRVSSGSDEWAD